MPDMTPPNAPVKDRSADVWILPSEVLPKPPHMPDTPTEPRDPRRDPRPGDVLASRVCHRRVLGVKPTRDGVVVSYAGLGSFPRGYTIRYSLSEWRRWARNAVVVYYTPDKGPDQG